MAKIKLDGVDAYSPEGQAIMEDDTKIVSKLTMTSVKDPADIEGPLTNEGFEVPKELIKQMCDAMDMFNAGMVKIALTDSNKIMGRNLYIVMCDPGNEIDILLATKDEG